MSTLCVKPVPEHQLDSIYHLLISGETRQSLLRLLGFIPTISDIRRHSFGDPDFQSDLLLGAYKGEQLVGSILGIHRPWKIGRETIGYIKWIFIKREYRRQGIGQLLFNDCEQQLRLRGCAKLLFGSCSPIYLFPGVPKEDYAIQYFLKQLGWNQGSNRISLDVNIPSLPTHCKQINPFSDTQKSLVFDVADSEEKKRFLFKFIEQEFSRSWALESLPAAYNDDNKSSFCCYVTGKNANDIYGFAAVGTANPGWFGPMGVKSEARMGGIGKLLVRNSLMLAKKRGIERLIISWVNDAEPFYRNVLGATVSRVIFLKYEKSLLIR